ncbi:helix-turn-helix domain-containing protein [Anaerobranca gottschalkii]|nr:helix-turn-helix domain-containing protein [Anaerobranca gottschalkii]
MIKTYKVMLLPNNKQKTKLKECAGVSRWAIIGL